MSDTDSAQTESFTETTRVSWLSRVAQSILGVFVGPLLIIGAVVLLYWNEGRAVQTTRSLGEGEALVVEGDQARVDPSNEGRLLHVAGNLKAIETLTDPEFGVVALAARLVRDVEMFQWEEKRETETRKNFGGSQDETTTYTYAKTWSNKAIGSNKFKRPDGHLNPPMRFSGYEVTAREATLGAFRPGQRVLSRLAASRTLNVKPAMVSGARAATSARVVGGKIFFGADPDQPQIGDVRISYRVTPDGPVSLIGRQTGADFTEYQTRAGDRLLIARAGISSAQDMFKRAETENRIETWLFRVLGIVMMLKGVYLILRPLAVLADVIPFVGSVVAGGIGLAALAATAIVVPLVIAAAWMHAHPITALTVLAAGCALAFAIMSLIDYRRAAVSQ